MFEKTLTDVVKGIRASKRDTALYISQCISEIKTEINSSDMYVKANALQKLTFLQMMGYGMSWASFATIEVMSSPRFAHKRIGYLAASQGFTQDTEVILLTTNLLKKELRGAVAPNMVGVYEAGLAINCISNIVTEDLARDLLPELTDLTSHPQPYLRKKAILCLFKVFVKYPQGLRLTFAQIQRCLDDQNPSVVSCAVNVITELSDKNPKNFLHLAPSFFQLLTTSSNNWMLIKVVKLLGSLVPEEPRLARKLLDPLANIVRNTQAKSLLYEAVHTITLCLPYCRKSDGSMPPNVPDIVTLCSQTLQNFVKEADQNLKYLGLVGFGSLMQSHPRVLSAPGYRPLILACLSDQDVTIRTRALGLLKGMASRKNLMELVSQLLNHVELATHSYKLDLVTKIVEMCSGEKYALLQDFEWYLDILFQLGHMRGLDSLGDMIRFQITDVALRVLPARAYAVRRSIQIILEGKTNAALLSSNDPYGDNGRGRHIMPEILPAVAWIIGEYSDLMRDSVSSDQIEGLKLALGKGNTKGEYHAVVQAMTAPSSCQELLTSTQKIYVQAAMKVFAAATADKKVSDAELEACVDTLNRNLPIYIQSTDVEVQERAFTAYELLSSLDLTNAYSPPGLVSLSEESNFTSDGESEDSGDGDLLGMDPGSLPSTKPAKKSKSKKNPSSPHSVASKCRNASVTLNYLLKPAPMKPTSAKTQKKKLLSPIGVEVDLEAPVDFDVFASLIDAEKTYLESARLTVEAVSFTQQKPLRVQERMQTNAVSSMDNFGASGISPADGLLRDNSSGFQKSNTPEVAGEMSNFNSKQSNSDPFYLHSAPSQDPGENRDAGHFGAIQLLDSDDDDAEPDAKKKKKKKKKEKRLKDKGKNKDQGDSSFLGFGDTSAPAMMNQTPIVYESDDDEDFQVAPRHRHSRKKAHGKEFAGLARVDLTAPLREDEVMPERKHRVVPETQPVGAPLPDEAKKKSSKKSKKKDKKKSSKAESVQPQPSAGSGVGDLLDLGIFGAESSAPAPISATSEYQPSLAMPSQLLGAQGGGDRIASAFDDILDLQAPVANSQFFQTSLSAENVSSPATNAQSGSSKKTGKRPWIKATVKTSNPSGSPVVDWAKVGFVFRVYRTTQGQGNAAVMIVVRVDNYMNNSLNNLTLMIKDFSNVSLGNLGPGSFFESNKLGPFVYSKIDASHDLKGTLTTSESSVPIKISLPASFNLTPMEGLMLEDLAQEMSISEMFSSSVKVDLSPGTATDTVKPMLCGYLRSAEVEAGTAASATTGTLAARAATGAKIFFMLKVKEKTAKIDVKCTNPQLGKAVISDLKKLAL